MLPQLLRQEKKHLWVTHLKKVWILPGMDTQTSLAKWGHMTKPIFKSSRKRQFCDVSPRRTIGNICQIALMITTLSHACKTAATISQSTFMFKNNKTRNRGKYSQCQASVPPISKSIPKDQPPTPSTLPAPSRFLLHRIGENSMTWPPEAGR